MVGFTPVSPKPESEYKKIQQLPPVRTSEFRPQETHEQQPFFEKDSRVSSRESDAKDKLDFHSSKDSGRKKNKISSGNFQKQNNEFIILFLEISRR
ncbi:MAG: hypothetical protein KDK41_13790, partial [Leptospiraceae bacterium]|nr:hypothetical protein [Leptospiraceae bacterium]